MKPSRVIIMGKEPQILRPLLEQEGLTVVETSPDVVVTHGGDGYLLDAERAFPGVPKLPIRYNSICKSCIDHDTTHAIKALGRGTISSSQVHKLETAINGQRHLVLNEFSLHHIKPNQAIRFSVQINDEEHVEQVIGDGLIVATSFGSHAYYRSITKSTFRLGIGLAYNNTTEAIDHLVVRESDTITIRLTRGPAYLLCDNDPELHELETGATAIIRQSSEVATLLGLDHFRCPDCGQPGLTTALGEEKPS